MFSCKRWTPARFVRSELTVENLASSEYGDIILKSMSQTKEKCDRFFWVDLNFEWYQDVMVFCVATVTVFI